MISSIKRGLPSIFLLALLATAVLLWPTSAYAYFDLPSSDKIVSTLVAPVFGDAAGGSPGGPLSTIISTFNGAILLIGGLLAAYTLLAGTMSTAHDGEMLGKKWSSMWVPIRTAFGTALCIPLGSGFCAAQLLIFWLAFQGLGLASNMGQTFMGTLTSTGFAPTAVAPSASEFAQTLLAAEVCVAAYNKAALSSPEAQATMLPLAKITQTSANTIMFGGGGNGHADNCGTVSFKSPDMLKVAWKGMEGLVTGGQTMSNNMEQVHKAHAAHQAAFSSLEGSMRSLAQQIVDAADSNSPPPSQSAFVAAVADYQRSVATAMKTEADQAAFEAFANSVAADGIRDLGAFPMKASFLQNKVSNAIRSSMPGIELGDGDMAHGTDISKYVSKLSQFANQKEDSWFTSDKGLSPETGPLTAIVSTIFGKGMQVLLDFSFKDKNPLMAAKDFGDAIMVTGEAVVGGATIYYVAAQATTEAVKEFNDNSPAAKVAKWATLGASSVISKAAAGGNSALALIVAMILIPIGVALITFGAGMSVYVPMIPYIVWIGCILGWFFLLVEAVFAAPLWAVMHLHPDGQEWSGRGGPGYMLLAGLILRPALLVLGLAAAFVVLQPLGDWINSTFFEAFFSAMGASMVGLVTMVIMAGMYCGLMVWIIHKVFSLTHIVPDQLLRWIGGGASQMGEFAGSALQDGKQQSTAAMAALGGYAGSVGGRALEARNAINQRASAQANRARTKNDVERDVGPLMDSSPSADASPGELAQSSKALHSAADTLDTLAKTPESKAEADALKEQAGKYREQAGKYASAAMQSQARSGDKASLASAQSAFKDRAEGTTLMAPLESARVSGRQGRADAMSGKHEAAAQNLSAASASWSQHANDLGALAASESDPNIKAGFLSMQEHAQANAAVYQSEAAAATSKANGGAGGDGGNTPPKTV